jgi:hypothetical protein
LTVFTTTQILSLHTFVMFSFQNMSSKRRRDDSDSDSEDAERYSHERHQLKVRMPGIIVPGHV